MRDSVRRRTPRVEGQSSNLSVFLLSFARSVFELRSPRQARLLPMEGLRGFAVTLVFLQHYAVQALQIGLAPGVAARAAAMLRSYGNLGVELFFVLSGYLIYRALLRRPPLFAFLVRRLQRIYPAFLVVFAATLAMNLFAPVAGKLPHDPWHLALILAGNLALLPGLVPMVRIVDVAWSLRYEMLFYLVAAGLVLGNRMDRFARRTRRAILLLLSGVFLLACSGSSGVPLRMLPFFAGTLLAEAMGERVPPWLGWAAPAAAALAWLALPLPAVTQELVQTVGFFALCAVCFRGTGAVSAAMCWAPLRWLGNMSYSYYLIHGAVVRTAMLVLARALPAGMPDWLFWAALPVLYAATLLAGAILFVIVEKPLSLRPQAAEPVTKPLAI